MSTAVMFASIPVGLARTRATLASSGKVTSRSRYGLGLPAFHNHHQASVLSGTSINFHSLRNHNSKNSRRFIATSPKSPISTHASWNQEVVWTEAPVLSVSEASESLFDIVIDISSIPELKSGHKIPGQYVQIKIGDSKPAFLAIASPPKVAESGAFEFLVKDIEGSTASKLCHLPKGSFVEISQVLGKGFNMSLAPPEEYPTLIIFATGSGISPIRSLIENGIDAKKRSDVRLYYGARNLIRMAYQNRFDAWEASGVKVIPVLSQPNEDWNGSTGFVQAAFSKEIGIIDPSKAAAVVVGQKAMAEEVTQILGSIGVPKDKVLMNF